MLFRNNVSGGCLMEHFPSISRVHGGEPLALRIPGRKHCRVCLVRRVHRAIPDC